MSVGGWWLSDDRTVLQKYQITAGTTIPAASYLVLTESQFNTGVNAFSIGSTGDEIVLSATSAGALTGYRSQVAFGAAAEDTSFGRIVTASAVPEFWPLVGRTFNAANAAPKIGPVIINEIMYHPLDLAGPLDNTRDEFVELHNVTTSPQAIGGWKLKGDCDFTFPSGTIIQPSDYIVVVGFNPAVDTASLAAFRSAYGITASVTIYGPFAPKLANDTASAEHAYPGTAIGAVTPFVLMDKAEYQDTTPWPVSADGTGPSLQRTSRTTIGNEPANWLAATATPGSVNSGQAAILDSDGDGLPDAWETANGLNRFSASDANADLDGDGQNNLIEYRAGTSPTSGASGFRITAPPTQQPGNQLRLQWQAVAGKTYRITSATNLTGPWTPVSTGIAAVLPTTTANIPMTGAQSFYRVEVENPTP